ncbi:MAG: serine/threonine-protein kinase [Myxococcaceae bacterium]
MSGPKKDPLDAFTVARPASADGDAPEAPTEPSTHLRELTEVRADPLLPDVIGGFRLDWVAGSGGMGTVWRAHDERLGTPVAVKVIKREALGDDGRVLQRSLREAMAAARVQHPSIAPVLGQGTLPDGRPWLATPFFEGASLSALLEEHERLPWGLAVPVLGELASALGAAHAANVVHRDVKPANVFLAKNSDGSVTLKLLDFGLALLGDGDGPVPQTSVQSFAGTADFVAPEQVLGQSLDARADLYALGITAWQLLSGRLPFQGGTNTQVMRRHLLDDVPPLEVAGLPRALEALIASLLAKAPVDRPSSAKDVRAQLEAIGVPEPEGDGPLQVLARTWPRAGWGSALKQWWKRR